MSSWYRPNALLDIAKAVRTMNAELAYECLRRLICSVLRRSGFDAASPDALVELEDKMGMRE